MDLHLIIVGISSTTMLVSAEARLRDRRRDTRASSTVTKLHNIPCTPATC